jgi:hypothetical protein
MKKLFTISVNIMAYSQQDAQAKIDFLLQLGSFMKDFDVTSLGTSLLNSLIISKLSQGKEVKKLQQTEIEVKPDKVSKLVEAFQALSGKLSNHHTQT